MMVADPAQSSLTPTVLTAETLPTYLSSKGWDCLNVVPLTGGVSNHAFWVDTSRGPLVLKQARSQLAVQMEWKADIRRIIREAEALRYCHDQLGPPTIPALYWLDSQMMVLAMEAVMPPAENYKQRLLEGVVKQDEVEQFAIILAKLHMHTLLFDGTVAKPAAVNAKLRFANSTFFDQLRLSPYYDATAARNPDLKTVYAALKHNCLTGGICLVHGDYSPKNVLVCSKGLTLLDFEVAHWGNPCFDIGFALTHYLGKAIHMPNNKQPLLKAASMFWQHYQQHSKVPASYLKQAGAHLAGLMLARVHGKSPLEYLNEAAQQQLANVAQTLLKGVDPNTLALSVETCIEAVTEAVAEVGG